MQFGMIQIITSLSIIDNPLIFDYKPLPLFLSSPNRRVEVNAVAGGPSFLER
jgi:hypothetical protein